MLEITALIEAILYCFVFLAGIVFSNVYIEKLKQSSWNFSKENASKIKILVLCSLTVFLVLLTYWNHCMSSSIFAPQKIGLLECIYIDPRDESLLRNIAIAVFINTTLFLGGLHQELYNGEIKRKFMRFYKKQFQWDLFKKLFVVNSVQIQVPICVELVYRAAISRIVDPQMHHPSFFVFFSGILYGVSHMINLLKFGEKYDFQFSFKSAMIQAIYNTLFGLYVSHIFSKSHTLISSIVIHVYANFMGYPEYVEILKGNTYDDRIKKSTIFYLFGVMGCLSCCLLL